MSFRIRRVGMWCGAGEKTYAIVHGELYISYKFSPHPKLNSSPGSFEMTNFI